MGKQPDRQTEREAALRELKHEIRQCWRALGMLHLRMQSELASSHGRDLSFGELRAKLDVVTARLTALEQACAQYENAFPPDQI